MLHKTLNTIYNRLNVSGKFSYHNRTFNLSIFIADSQNLNKWGLEELRAVIVEFQDH